MSEPDNTYGLRQEQIVITHQDRRELWLAIATCLSTIGGAISALAAVVKRLA